MEGVKQDSYGLVSKNSYKITRRVEKIQHDT
jgi:hypothetical protein